MEGITLPLKTGGEAVYLALGAALGRAAHKAYAAGLRAMCIGAVIHTSNLMNIIGISSQAWAGQPLPP